MSLLMLAAAAPSNAAPWVEGGDRAIRADVELLAAYGLIDGLVTSWPIPKGQFNRLRDDTLLAQQPPHVQVAARRVLANLYGDSLVGVVELRGANSPAVVRDFGTLARDEVDVRAGLDYENGSFDARLRGGLISDASGDDNYTSADDSYLSMRAWNLRFYGGWVEQWQGPGAHSALVLSNNTRPYPKIGVMRENPAAFESPWFNWIGPVYSNFSVGLLDDKRRDENTVLVNWRLAANPLPGLELAGMRTIAFCGGKGPEEGNGHTCDPFKAAFHVVNIDSSANKTNDQATIEVKYTGHAGPTTWSPYIQAMSESSFAYFSRLGGVSLGGPWGDAGAHWQLVGEYTTSIATYAIGGTTPEHGEAYRNSGYEDGSRYRNRTLGFSLDSDSRLVAVSGLFVSAKGWSYGLSYYHVNISTPELAALEARPQNITYRNTVSPVPLTFDEVDLGLTVPFGGLSIELLARGRSKKLPAELGGRLDGEVSLSYRF